jgi:hypothetical protein
MGNKMQFKSFMEALKGKQHKIDKNKNGQIDAHDFKLLRKEESEETTETIEESEERMARADYKVGASGRKSHKEIVFKDAESKEEDKKEMKEAKMSDSDMAKRERIVKGMKKNLSGFKARYGDRAKEVMYATATKQAMKEETVEEAVQKADIPAYLRKQQGQAPLKMSDLKRKDTISDKENLAKLRGVKEENELEEGVFTDEEGIAKKLVAKHGKNVQSHDIKLALHLHPEGHKTTVDRVAGHVKKMLSVKEEVELDESVFADKEQAQAMASKLKAKHEDGNYSVVADKDKHRVVHAYHSDSRVKKDIAKLNEEQIDEKSEQAKRNKIMKNMMDASRGARYKLNNPVPDADPEHKNARAHNVAIGRALRNEEEKPPFDGPYTKTKPAKNSDGTPQSPMSRARELAKQAMKQKMKEEFDIEMSDDQADSILDYIDEQAPVAPVPDKKYIKGTPENKAYKATKKPINGMPTNKMSCEEVEQVNEYSMDDLRKDADAHLKKSIDKQSDDRIAALKNPPKKKGFFARVGEKQINMVKGAYKGLTKEETALDEVEKKTLSYGDFVSNLLEYESKDGVYRNKGTYGGSYTDPEGADDADDKKPKQQPAEKRGRGRPAGAKSGAGKITGTSKLYK